MIIRNYEKKTLIYFLIVFLFLGEVFFILFTCVHKEYKYLKVNGIVVKNNLVLVMINNSDKKILRKNSFLYYKNDKYLFKIEEDRGQLLRKGYSELLISFDFSKENKQLKANDIMELVVIEEKINLITFFKLIWEGD